MATFSDWFKTAKSKNIPLEKRLRVDLEKDIERLYSSGLPVFEKLIVEGSQYDRNKIDKFCNNHELIWTRVYNTNDYGERYSKFEIKPDEVTNFIDNLDVNLDKFTIQIFECHKNKFGGNVITNDYETRIEVANGPQDIVGKSLDHFFHGWISNTGRLEFSENDVTEDMKKATWNTLDYLKIARGEYVKGYFEFIVSDKNEVFFLDYKNKAI